MHDKAVRRRRAVLAGLVVLSLIQEGASRALKPVRDLFGWFGDTLDAKSERDKLKAERDALRREVAELSLAQSDFEQLQEMRQATSALGLDAYEPVPARVITRSNNVWYSTLQINKGADDGVQPDQPVVNGEGLVGKVKSVSGGSAWGMLLTDQSFGVSAKAVAPG